MADIELEIATHGDGSGLAMVGTETDRLASEIGKLRESFDAHSRATVEAAEHLGEMQKALENVREWVNLTGEAIKEVMTMGFEKLIDFVKESVQEYLNFEKASRSLSAVAGAMTPMLVEQAEAFQNNLNANKETTMAMQELMLRYGVAPDQIKATTQAILDYSAKTGVDAVSATQKLLIGVDNGGKGLKRIGVAYQATGKFSAGPPARHGGPREALHRVQPPPLRPQWRARWSLWPFRRRSWQSSSGSSSAWWSRRRLASFRSSQRE